MSYPASVLSRDPHFRQRREKIVGDLRQRGATSPERAMPLPPETYHARTVRALMLDMVVVEARPGHFYYDEAAAAAADRKHKLLPLLMGAIMLVAAVAIFVSNQH